MGYGCVLGTVYLFTEEHTGPPTFRLSGLVQKRTDPRIRYKLGVLALTESDKHKMQLNLNHIPKPTLHAQSSTFFSLPVDYRIVYVTIYPLIHVSHIVLPDCANFSRRINACLSLMILEDISTSI
jgi:hypothetical protein